MEIEILFSSPFDSLSGKFRSILIPFFVWYKIKTSIKVKIINIKSNILDNSKKKGAKKPITKKAAIADRQ